MAAGEMREGLAFWIIVSEAEVTGSVMVAQIWEGLADESTDNRFASSLVVTGPRCCIQPSRARSRMASGVEIDDCNSGGSGEKAAFTYIDVKALAFSVATQNSRSADEGEDGAAGFDEVVHPVGESKLDPPRLPRRANLGTRSDDISTGTDVEGRRNRLLAGKPEEYCEIGVA